LRPARTFSLAVFWVLYSALPSPLLRALLGFRSQGLGASFGFSLALLLRGCLSRRSRGVQGPRRWQRLRRWRKRSFRGERSEQLFAPQAYFFGEVCGKSEVARLRYWNCELAPSASPLSFSLLRRPFLKPFFALQTASKTYLGRWGGSTGAYVHTQHKALLVCAGGGWGAYSQQGTCAAAPLRLRLGVVGGGGGRGAYLCSALPSPLPRALVESGWFLQVPGAGSPLWFLSRPPAPWLPLANEGVGA
jgi:hypothetical protein